MSRTHTYWEVTVIKVIYLQLVLVTVALELLNHCTSQLHSIEACRVLCAVCTWLNGCITFHHCWVDARLNAAADAVVVQHGCSSHQLTGLLRWVQHRATRLVKTAESWLQQPKTALDHHTSPAVCYVIGFLWFTGSCTEWSEEPRLQWITGITYMLINKTLIYCQSVKSADNIHFNC